MKQIDACIVDGQPSPAFERLLNLTKNRPVGWPEVDTVAQVSGVRYESVRHYFAGGACAHHTIRRVEAALEKINPERGLGR